MDELNDFLKLNGFVLAVEPVISKKYFGNYICEYTNNAFGTRIRLISDRGYIYVYISRLETDRWYSIISILMSLYKKRRRCFLTKDQETDWNYFHNLTSSKDIIQTDIQVKLLRRYFNEVMTIFYENNLQFLSKIESEEIEINRFIENS
jgi:hypothetical protein